MKHRFLLIACMGVILLVAAAYWVGSAAASTGCFPDTNGHWAETFICWLKDNNISSDYPDGTYRPNNPITRAEMAVMLQKQAEVPPTTGVMTISAGNTDWEAYGGYQDDVDIYTSYTHTIWTSSVADTVYFHLFPTLPNTLYGHRMRLLGVEICYTASAQAVLSYVEIYTLVKPSMGPGYQPHVMDDMDRTDVACRYYALPAVVHLTVEDLVVVEIDVHFQSVGAWFGMDRTTFFLQPTDNPAILPAGLANLP